MTVTMIYIVYIALYVQSRDGNLHMHTKYSELRDYPIVWTRD